MFKYRSKIKIWTKIGTITRVLILSSLNKFSVLVLYIQKRLNRRFETLFWQNIDQSLTRISSGSPKCQNLTKIWRILSLILMEIHAEQYLFSAKEFVILGFKTSRSGFFHVRKGWNIARSILEVQIRLIH